MYRDLERGLVDLAEDAADGIGYIALLAHIQLDLALETAVPGVHGLHHL
jgi:hypothetical protein